jgi:putative membrane protein
MFIERKFPWKVVWIFGWRNLLVTALLAGAVYIAYEIMGWTFISVPFLPVATIGTAVAFYVGFKNNSSYDRLWEARRIWGSITNTSRCWAVSVRALVGHRQVNDDPEAVNEAVRELIYRQIAWANALRLQLRRPTPLNASDQSSPQIQAVKGVGLGANGFDEEVKTTLAAFSVQTEHRELPEKGNVAVHLLHEQAQRLADLKRRKWLDEYEHSDLMRHIMECVHHQGAAERIKTFPFPRQYANFSLIFIRLFVFLLPLGLVRDLAALGPGASWLVIPFSVLISWVFYSMEQVGDASENPFEGGINDVPMSAICRNIEIDLKELMGERDLPQRLQPIDGILL